MNRSTPLARTGPLRRKTPIPRGSVRLARTRTVPAARPSTGFTAATRQLIIARDDARCQACGRHDGQAPLELQHRLARGQGGRHGAAALAINRPENGVVLCRSDHALAESRDPLMNARGMWLRTGQDPASTAIVDWAGRAWLLHPDGSRERWPALPAVSNA